MVSVELTSGCVTLWVYHDGPLSPEAAEEFDDATGEMMADIPQSDWEVYRPAELPPVTVAFVRVDAVEPLPVSGCPVYHRKEVVVAG